MQNTFLWQFLIELGSGWAQSCHGILWGLSFTILMISSNPLDCYSHKIAVSTAQYHSPVSPHTKIPPETIDGWDEGVGRRLQNNSLKQLLAAAATAKSLQSCPTATPYTTAHQAPLSPGFSRQEYWSGLPFPSSMHACMLSYFSHV